MKKLTKILSMVLISVLAVTMMIGCGKKEPADTVAKAYYAAIANSDTSQLKSLGLSEDESKEFNDKRKETLVTNTKNNFKIGGIDISDDEAGKIVDAQLNAMKKLTATVTLKSSDKETSIVNIKTNYLKISEIDQKAADDAITDVQAMGLTDQNEFLKQFKEKYIANLLEGLKNAEMSTDTIEKDFTFTMQTTKIGEKTVKMWGAENPTTFSKDLNAMITK